MAQVTFKYRYELMDLAFDKNIPSIYDLLTKVQVRNEGVACTDGTHIYVNPDEFNKYNVKDQFFILCHELLHILYKHNEMLKSDKYPNSKLLNVCQDVVINEKLKRRLRFHTEDGLYLSTINKILNNMGYKDYSGALTTNDLYQTLSQLSNSRLNQIENLYDPESIIDNPDDNEEQDTSSVTETLTELRKVLRISNKQLLEENPDMEFEDMTATDPDDNPDRTSEGILTSMDDGIQRSYIKERDIIKYVKQFLGNETEVKGRSRTYSRPNRRYQHQDLLLKGYKTTTNVKQIAIYLDTSGSMSKRFVNELYNTLKDLHKTTTFKFYTFDIYVHEEDFHSDTIYVGGGTWINEVLNHIKKNNHDHAIMITDCQDNFSLSGFNHNLRIFTNNNKFISNNSLVDVIYWL